MKHAPLLVLAATLLSPLALAEGGPRQDAAQRPGDARPAQKQGMAHDCEEMDSCFIEELKLSDDQQQKIRGIMDEARKQRDELRNDTFSRIKAVLTPEQSRRLEAHRADMMKSRAEGMRERAGQMDRRARDRQDKR